MLPMARRQLLAGIGGAAGLAALGGTAQAQGTPKRGGTLIASWGGFEPQALFVPPGGGSSPFLTSTKVLERLVKLNQKLEFEPVLAESVEAAPDFRSYTLRLRQGVTWHDGKPLTADDLVFSIEKYWKPMSMGVALKALEGAEKLDGRTVRMRFATPVPDFFLQSLLANSGGLVIPKHIYEVGEILTNPANNKPIGTGPFVVKEWARGSHVEYARNENYWDEGKPYLDRLFIRWWRDPASRLAAFESGALDLAVWNPIPFPEMDRLAKTGKFVAVEKGFENYAWASTIEFNMRREPFKRREVRQALMMAIDRQLACDTVWFGRARPGTSPISSENTVFHAKDLPRYPFDPKRAAQMLDAAGLPRKRGGRFTVNLVSAGWFEENGRLAQIVKQGFEDIDLQVNLAVPDRSTSIKRIYTDYDYDVALSNNASPIEPVPLITHYYTTDGIIKGAAFRNANGYSNPEMDALVEKLAIETDPAKRKALAVDFQKLAVTDLNYATLAELQSFSVAKPDVRNIATSSNWMGETWSDLWLDR